MTQIDPHRLFQTFSSLVSIDSPSLGERAFADALFSRLERLGFTCREDSAAAAIGGNCGNVYARLEGTLPGPPLLFSSHMDTVEPAKGKEAILHDDGKITGNGTAVLGADDVSGIACILEAVEAIKEAGLPHRSIELLFTVAEEIYSRGAMVFDYSQLQAKEAYVLDLSGPIGSLAHRAPTILAFSAVFSGKSAHAGFAPETGVHAVRAAAAAVAALEMGQIDPLSTCNIGRIEGGGATNIVPDKCTVWGEIRSFHHETALSHFEAVEAQFHAAASAIGASVALTHHIGCTAYETDANAPVVRRFQRACDACQVPFDPISTFGGSDNNHFLLHGLSGVVLACAMGNCHSTEEYSSIEDLKQCTALVAQLMTDPQ